MVVGVDAAVATEVMLCGVGVELVETQCLLALDDFDSGKRDGGDDCAFAPANGAVAPARIDHTIGEIKFKHHGAAMATEAMLRENLGGTNLFE